MTDKDARDMHRLAVGAGEAPTDAQIMPCPFCSGMASHHETFRHGHYVLCDTQDCHASTNHKATKDEAITAWNRRATSPPAPSSPAPVAGDIRPRLQKVSDFWAHYRNCNESWQDENDGGAQAMVEELEAVIAALAAPSTIQGLSDAEIEQAAIKCGAFGIDTRRIAMRTVRAILALQNTPVAQGLTDAEILRIAYAYLGDNGPQDTRVINFARAILANPAAPSPESGS